MSPAATRRYRVSFVNWEHYETFVFADHWQIAIDKAAAM